MSNNLRCVSKRSSFTWCLHFRAGEKVSSIHLHFKWKFNKVNHADIFALGVNANFWGEGIENVPFSCMVHFSLFRKYREKLFFLLNSHGRLS